MPALAAIVKRIDHVVVRVDDPCPLFELLTDTLALPVAWPMQSHGFYASGGVSVGNACLEIARVGRPKVHSAGSAHLLGVALEPYPLDVSLRELAARGIPHSPPVPFAGERPDGTRGVRWTNVLLGGLAGEGRGALLRTHWWPDNPLAERVLVPLARMAVISHWASLASSPAGLPMVFMCEYADEEVEAALASGRASLQETRGGPMELVGLAEVVLGATHPERVRQRWQNLFAPLLPMDRGFWQPASGPGLRVVAHDENILLALTFRTRSLARAEAWLRAARMLGGVAAGQLAIDPVAVYGLDIRLIQ